MGCSFSGQVSASSIYKNDHSWEEKAKWGKELGVNTWGKEIVCMDTIHKHLFMGSRFSAQQVIDNRTLTDQYGNIYSTKKFYTVCVASERTCEYCVMSSRFSRYNIHDRANQTDDFIAIAKQTAKQIRKKLRAGHHVLVHCHSGRNRSALAILVYCASYTYMTYENALLQIRRHNSSRFSSQSTLQNGQFTTSVREQWNQLIAMK